MPLGGLWRGRRVTLGIETATRRKPQLFAALPSALAAAVLVASTGTAPAQQMSLPGKFDVSATGAALYSIPIAVPPGTAGMTPALTLDYNSQSGDGILGIGWSLGGLPSIGRCARTMAQDGVVGGVNYDANDRFCLDGERLVAINSGTYGADGTEYRTEVDGFSRIISHGTAGNGPAWFEVHTKSGQVMEFGNTSDSQILAQGKSTARSWALDKVTDSKGNYFTVTYTNDTTNGQAYPIEIDYTGNAAAGLAPADKVQFVYATRPDITPAYQAGSLIKTTVRLTDVKAYAGATLVSDYQLTYRQSSSSGRSEINGVTRCGADGNCLPASGFQWKDGSNNFNQPVGGNPSGSGLVNNGNWGGPGVYTTLAADVNGDGKADLVFVYPSSTGLWIWTLLSNGDGTYTVQGGNPSGSGLVNNWNWGSTGTYTALAADVNGDGKTDLVLVGPTTTGLWVWTLLSNGDGTYTVQGGNPSGSGLVNNGNWGGPGVYTTLAADVNGDGRADLVFVYPTSTGLWVWTLLSKGDGTYTVQGGNPSGSGLVNNWNWGSTGTYTELAADVNGDGKADLVLAGPTTTGLWVWTLLSNGDGTYTVQGGNPSGSGLVNNGNWGGPGVYTTLAADVNGDGRTDLAFVYPTSTGLWVWTLLSNGDGTYTVQGGNPSGSGLVNNWNWGGPGVYTTLTADVNGDGKADLVFVYPSSTGLWVWTLVSNGDGTYTAQGGNQSGSGLINNWNWGGGVYSTLAADVNGDGKADLALVGPTTTGLWVWTTLAAGGVGTDLVTSVSTGLGASTSIGYAPLTNTSVYTKDTNAAYPQQDVQAPVYVASRVDASNGIGGSYSSTYGYVGAKFDLSGRGFLGFRQMTVADLQTSITQATNYHQDFPYLGLIASQIKTLNGQTLNSTTDTYQFLNASGAAMLGTPTNAAAPYQVSLSQSVDGSFDLDGSVIPPVTTNYQYDAFGNATQIIVSTPDGAAKTTTNTYTNDTTNWFLGRLTNATVTSTLP